MIERKLIKPVAVDLFAGGGGLSLGLKRAGFSVCAAVELDRFASATYAANHPDAVLFSKDIRTVTAGELLRTSPTNSIQLIAACPPCQSFSSLTSKYKSKDSREELIFEFARLVKQLLPPTIMMENVPGLAGKGAHLFQPVLNQLRRAGYKLEHKVLEVADYGVPQRRRRLVLLGSLTRKLKIPTSTHSESAQHGKAQWTTVRDVIGHMAAPISLATAKQTNGPRAANWHVSRNLEQINIERLLATKAGESRTALPEALRPECHKADKGFTNVYGRMSWDRPSPTITGGCTTLSKGRFGHPEQTRTLSVREAAALQSFPDDYEFATDFIDKACIIIGNALPPKFAEVMAGAFREVLQGDEDARSKEIQARVFKSSH